MVNMCTLRQYDGFKQKLHSVFWLDTFTFIFTFPLKYNFSVFCPPLGRKVRVIVLPFPCTESSWTPAVGWKLLVCNTLLFLSETALQKSPDKTKTQGMVLMWVTCADTFSFVLFGMLYSVKASYFIFVSLL